MVKKHLTKTCPGCKGKKEMGYWDYSGPYAYYHYVFCFVCGGTGVVKNEK